MNFVLIWCAFNLRFPLTLNLTDFLLIESQKKKLFFLILLKMIMYEMNRLEANKTFMRFMHIVWFWHPRVRTCWRCFPTILQHQVQWYNSTNSWMVITMCVHLTSLLIMRIRRGFKFPKIRWRMCMQSRTDWRWHQSHINVDNSWFQTWVPTTAWQFDPFVAF